MNDYWQKILAWTSAVVLAPILVAGGAAAAAQTPAESGDLPDLEVVLPDSLLRAKGMVTVHNTGTANAGPSTLAVQCRRQTFELQEDCGGKPGVDEYSTVGFPDARAVQLGRILAGELVTVQIPGWRDLTIRSDRTYVFRVKADVEGTVAETNEENNVEKTVLYLN
ncbi:MAG: hypothetical protein L0H83_14395 [Salinisphaera sp.]|nr:hypothetical protein [Salinisphaera sp.]